MVSPVFLIAYPCFLVSTPVLGRSIHPEVFCKEGVLKKFAKFTRKHQCRRFFSNDVVGLGPATLLKKRLRHRCFPVVSAKNLRTPFFTKHLRWLLLMWISLPISPLNEVTLSDDFGVCCLTSLACVAINGFLLWRRVQNNFCFLQGLS